MSGTPFPNSATDLPFDRRRRTLEMSNSLPELPRAARMRPKLGSAPNIAALTRLEATMERAATLASLSSLAPVT